MKFLVSSGCYGEIAKTLIFCLINQDRFLDRSPLDRLGNGISHKMGRRFLRRGTCTFSSSGTAIYGVSLIHNQLGLDALVDCFKN